MEGDARRVRRRGIAIWGLGLALLGLFSTARPAGLSGLSDRTPCRTASFEGDAFTVCQYGPGTSELRLVYRDRNGPISDLANLKAQLGPDARRVQFAMNAGMYDKDQRPLGLFIAHGETQHPANLGAGGGNFFLLPNGVFWIDGQGAPHIDETKTFTASDAKAEWATQSGPLLLHASQTHPAIAPNGQSLAVRNGVGVRRGEALFVISDGPVSFGRLTRFFRDGRGCTDALYLDGAVSSLWAPGLGRLDSRTGLGAFVIVLRKARG